MNSHATVFDAVVIGGGFYGCAIAIYLAQQRGAKRVILLENSTALLARASYSNQARIHNGYHYPRSFTTAYRSRINLPKFVRDWPDAVERDFTKLYAIARRNSKVTARQFERFCKDIGAPLRPAGTALKKLFEPQLIEDVFMVEEYAFDTTKLEKWATEELNKCGVTVRFSAKATQILCAENNLLRTIFTSALNEQESMVSPYVFNCTYSGLNQIEGDFPGVKSELKQEITEMALVKMPSSLSGLGVTVMDGPFFSMMPFPARNLHTLSHVRYTPHLHWNDQRGVDPYKKLQLYPQESRFDRMMRDSSRYMPGLAAATHVDSLFEVKTVLTNTEGNDGRPILFEKCVRLPGCYSVLGGKIDNVYDILDRLGKEKLDRINSRQEFQSGDVYG